MHSKHSRLVRWVVVLAAAGTMFQLGSCIPDGTLQYLKNFNYGGTVLNMDSVTYSFLTSGYTGPGVDPDIDPACTYPPYCEDDPFVGDLTP